MSVAVYIAFIFCFEFSNVGKRIGVLSCGPRFDLKVTVFAYCLIQGCGVTSEHQKTNMKSRDWIQLSVVNVH